MTSETSFRYACYAHTSHVSHVTRNTHVFYEIKKPNDFGGLVNSLPKRDRVFFVTSATVTRVTRYIHTGDRLQRPQSRRERVCYRHSASTQAHTAQNPHNRPYRLLKAFAMSTHPHNTCNAPRHSLQACISTCDPKQSRNCGEKRGYPTGVVE